VSAVLNLPAAVQTSEPEADLFGPVPSPAADQAPTLRHDVRLTFTGVLAERPHVASKQLDDGHFLPVLVLDLDDVGAGHHRMTVHVPYTDATREQAEHQARRMHKGEPVTVATALTQIRLFLPAASLVVSTTPPQEGPCPQSTSR